MPETPTQLPSTVTALQALVAQQMAEKAEQQARLVELERENKRQSARIFTLQEQLNLALARRFAASSEKLSPDQFRLFNEAEVDARLALGEEEADGTINVPAHARKKRGRKPLPDTLPRTEVIYELAGDDLNCPHDGQALKVIGEAASEQLDIVPATIRVIRHIRRQYACDCGQCIRTAALPAQPIPKSMASPDLLAHITVSKYQDALPLYRQETILQRIGVDIPRATLANWMIKAGQLVQPLINLLRDQLLAHDLIQMDETTVQVLKESGKAARSKSYLWLQRGGPPGHPVVLYDYDQGRGQVVPLRLPAGFKGYLQTDGHDGYNAVVAAQQLTHVGCMAHARRRFSEAVKAQGRNGKTGKAHQGLAFIQQLYRVETEARHLHPEQRRELRQENAIPILQQLRQWLDQSLPQERPCGICTTSGTSW
jgi:transposase